MKFSGITRLLFIYLFLLFSSGSKAQLSIPYSQDFETTGGTGWSVITTGNSATNWEYGTPSYGFTNSSHSGNFCWDINLNAPYDTNAQTYLYTPEFNLNASNPAQLTFWQNRNSEDQWDGMHIEYSINNGLTWIQLGIANDALGINWYNALNIAATNLAGWTGFSNGWKECRYNLSQFQNQIVQFRFVFTSDGVTSTDGVSIDDFSVTPFPDYDIYLEQILTPVSRLTAATVNPGLQLLILNNGAQTINGCNLSLKIDNNAVSTIFYSGTLSSGSLSIVTFPSFTVPPYNFNICVFADIPLDADHSNDTLCATALGVTTIVPDYSDNFDGVNYGWSNNTLQNVTQWQLDSLSALGQHSAFNSWHHVSVDNAYAELWSPLFNFSGIHNAELSFWQRFDTEEGFDGTRLDYSIDSGGTWQTLGSYNDLDAANWYNTIQSQTTILPAWTNSSNGWIKSTHNLSEVDNMPNVIFRFVFASDFTVSKIGTSIDDFSISKPENFDVAILSVKPDLRLSVANQLSEPVKIIFKNKGANAASNFPIKYSINNGTPVTLTYNGNLLPNMVDSILLPAYTTPLGYYNFSAYTDLSNDLKRSNDSIHINLQGNLPFTPSSLNNFDNGNNDGWFAETNNPNTNWELGTPDYGVTTGAHSGINAWDINLTTTYANQTECYLYSPVYDLSGAINPRISFWQNRSISNAGDDFFRVEYADNSNPGFFLTLGTNNDVNGTNWYLNNSSWDGTSSGWIQSKYKLLSLGASSIRFRFAFISGFFSNGNGVSIDDFAVITDYHNDATIDTIFSPSDPEFAGVNINTGIRLKNAGINPLTTLDIKYILNNGAVKTYNWTGSLTQNSSAAVFLQPLQANAGINTIKIFTDLSNDEYRDNDTLIKTFFADTILNLPYSNTFHNNPQWKTTAGFSNTNWEWGTPSYGATSSAHSGNSCYDINLNSHYGNAAQSILYSPFFRFTNAINTNISFWLNYNSEADQDGLKLEFSYDRINWTQLGILNDPNAVNWYNSLLWPANSPGWSGNSNGWKQCTYNGSALNGSGNVQFRFVFTSDLSFTYEGFSMDDFTLSQTVGLSENKATDFFLLAPNPVNDELNISIKNTRAENLTLIINDITGREVMRKELKKEQSDYKISVSLLSQGIYQLQLQNKNEIHTQKFIKQ